ncbi:MAG: hypothetical protein E7663_06060 [Ruminococcaceae bacterium]|nr:hypothetical protein [Oscillospiraceae bacterium]
MDNVIVRVIELPDAIPAVTVLDEDGDYNIYINGRLSKDNYEDAVRHELRHINQEHFYQKKPVRVCEDEANERCERPSTKLSR